MDQPNFVLQKRFLGRVSGTPAITSKGSSRHANEYITQKDLYGRNSTPAASSGDQLTQAPKILQQKVYFGKTRRSGASKRSPIIKEEANVYSPPTSFKPDSNPNQEIQTLQDPSNTILAFLDTYKSMQLLLLTQLTEQLATQRSQIALLVQRLQEEHERHTITFQLLIKTSTEKFQIGNLLTMALSFINTTNLTAALLEVPTETSQGNNVPSLSSAINSTPNLTVQPPGISTVNLQGNNLPSTSISTNSTFNPIIQSPEPSTELPQGKFSHTNSNSTTILSTLPPVDTSDSSTGNSPPSPSPAIAYQHPTFSHPALTRNPATHTALKASTTHLTHPLP